MISAVSLRREQRKMMFKKGKKATGETRLMITLLFLFCGWVCLLGMGFVFASEDESEYVPVEDPLVLAGLEEWRDAKFGLMMHWGPYSQWGVVESWSICSEDWIKRPEDHYEDYKRKYKKLPSTFNPVRFDPDKWAEAAEAAGMRYVVFTTKHHDGFCMFDTRTTEYRITGPGSAFASHPKADVTRAIFESFRKRGLKTGAYFSKPDWNSEDYWWPYYATPDRHVNYDPALHPERWRRFKDFTFRQIEELMTGYGPVDILWLDGAWVRPLKNMPDEFKDWAKKKEYNQDIDMARIVAMARSHQPGLIVVDRWVSGPYENYLTPEQKIPEKPLSVPWESCITMAEGWSYNKNHTYKPVRQLLHMMVDIVAKGGNFLLNIGPSPEGDWAAEAYDRLEGIGAWMAVNGEAIYKTRPVPPFKDGRVCLTGKKDGTVYLVYLAEEGRVDLPSVIRLSDYRPPEGSVLEFVGASGQLDWKPSGKGIEITVPESIRRNPPCLHAWTVKVNLKD